MTVNEEQRQVVGTRCKTVQGAVSEKWPVGVVRQAAPQRRAEERNKVQDGMRAK